MNNLDLDHLLFGTLPDIVCSLLSFPEFFIVYDLDVYVFAVFFFFYHFLGGQLGFAVIDYAKHFYFLPLA